MPADPVTAATPAAPALPAPSATREVDGPRLCARSVGRLAAPRASRRRPGGTPSKGR